MTDLRIFKYRLEITDEQVIQLPAGARILSCQAQRGELVLWALVDVSAEFSPMRVRIFGTGHPIPDAEIYFIDTVQIDELVWHVFEELRDG